MNRKEFDSEFWVSILRKILHLSDNEIDASIRNDINNVLADGDFRPHVVWNTYKRILDMSVRYSATSSFVMSVIDLEPYYEPPHGGLNQADGSIQSAPWRQAE